MKFFKDNDGKVVIVQFPNALLLTWLILVVISIFISDHMLKTSVDQLKNAVLFAWSYMEVSAGASWFRRILGCVVMITIIVSYFV